MIEIDHGRNSPIPTGAIDRTIVRSRRRRQMLPEVQEPSDRMSDRSRSPDVCRSPNVPHPRMFGLRPAKPRSRVKELCAVWLGRRTFASGIGGSVITECVGGRRASTASMPRELGTEGCRSQRDRFSPPLT